MILDQFFKGEISISFEIGNQTSNRNIKDQRKKAKKANKRSERKVNAVADVLENFTLDMSGNSDGQDYDFEADFE